MIKDFARRMKSDVIMLWFAMRDQRTPVHAKLLGMVVVSYAISPIDLIPDFIPILGYLDDLILLPIGIWLVIKLVPSVVMQDARVKAAELSKENRPVSRIAAIIIIFIWILLCAATFGIVFDLHP